MTDKEITASSTAMRPATTSDLIAMAVSQNVDIDKLTKLIDLQERREAAEAKKEYIKARSGFASECVQIVKLSKGHNSNYAKLGDELTVVTPMLAKHGLTHSWVTNQDSAVITVTCILTHEMGHSESTSLCSAPETSGSKNSIQAIGSAVSYLKRYTFESICGLASIDDDGQTANTASGADSPTAQRKQLEPGSGQWKNAVAAYQRDGNFDKVLARIDISEAHQKMIVEQAK